MRRAGPREESRDGLVLLMEPIEQVGGGGGGGGG